MRYLCALHAVFTYFFYYYLCYAGAGWACEEELTLRRGCLFDPAAVSQSVCVCASARFDERVMV